ncbi:MAG: aminopeptidase [Bacteroidetes bacterium]|nr:aminopeptidase [Bacteroidota bacterium]
MYSFLYVSFADHVAIDTALHINSYFATETQARAAAADLTKRGYHTMIYKTVGMSSTLLNRKLLSYPDEAIAFILFHEVIHRNMLHLGHPIAYRFEESLADAVANYACVRFARHTHLLDTTAACIQQDVFEKAYQYINAQRKILDRKSIAARRKIYIRCTTIIQQIAQPGNQFQKDRMNYPVNNAYFLRMQDYASHYFTIRQMIGYSFDLSRAIAAIRAMPQAAVSK